MAQSSTKPSALPNTRLTSQVYCIPRSEVDSKWEVLEEGCQDRIHELLSVIESQTLSKSNTIRAPKSADSLSRTSNRDHEGGQSAIRSSSERICAKLNAIPFPPTKLLRSEDISLTRARSIHAEQIWSLDGLVDIRRLVESQLVPAEHSVTLLDREIDREQTLLEQDDGLLNALEKNASKQRAARAESLRRMHPSLKELRKCAVDHGAAEMEITTQKPVASVECGHDPELARLMRQLSSHLNSLEGNVGPLISLADQLDDAKTELDDLLFRHLPAEQYEDVTYRP